MMVVVLIQVRVAQLIVIQKRTKKSFPLVHSAYADKNSHWQEEQACVHMIQE